MIREQFILDVHDELIIDAFAGGGGMSTAIEQGTGRHVDIAFNHAEDALSMHEANHPQTSHKPVDMREACPRGVTRGRRTGLFHMSPDCTDHSQAKAGQPRDKKIRALTWIGLRWGGQAQPRVITLENVKQILKWGRLIAKRCKETGRVVKIDGTVAAPGEQVPVHEQHLVGDKRHAGCNWRRFVRSLRAMGYEVEWRVLCAADYGAPTTRERLFMVARRDGRPIAWPAPTHAKEPARGSGLKKWRSAAECIDFALPCPSIFTRKKPLADATLKRIAEGVRRFVLEHGDPFIVPVTHSGERPVHDIRDPLRTVTTAKRGELGLIAPTLVQVAHGEGKPGGKQRGTGAHDVRLPVGTLPTSNSFAVASAFLAQMNGGVNGHQSYGHDLREPVSTINTKASQQQLVAAHLAHLQNNCDGRDVRDPVRTIKAGGQVHGVVQCTLAPEDEAGALRVAAFLIRYYKSGGQWAHLKDPMHTLTVKERIALVTVTIRGTPFVIVDIGLRMLKPRELFNAQGFPAHYIIDRGHDGRKFTIEQQVRMCGNSVSPPPARALIRANVPELCVKFGDERRELVAAL